MEILLVTMRLCLFAIFAFAGIGKVLDPEGSKKAAEDFGVPGMVSKPVSILLPLTEFAIAVLLLPTQTAWFGAVAAIGLLLIFTAGMTWQIWQGNAPDCHCFGQIHSEPVGKKSLVRNLVFALPAVILIASGPENQGLNIFDSTSDNSETNAMQVIIGLSVLGFLAAIVFFLKKISEQQTQIMRRIEVLELISHEGGKQVERDDVNDPSTGLPIGSPVPEFALPNIDGESVAFDRILPNDNPTLLFFVSPSCNPCEALIPEFQKWQMELGKSVNFSFISTGKAKDNTEKFGEPGFENLYLQENNEIAEMLGAEWTPTALLVNSDGTLASRPAAGDTAIRVLIDNVKETNLNRDFIYITNGNLTKLGESVPDFSLEDLEGNEVSADYFKQKKTLVTYWSMTCPHCVNMMEALSDWEKSRDADDPHLLVISSGEADAHKDMGLASPIVLDDEHEVGPEFGMSGTPSGVLVNEEGKIVSETAVGAGQIWALIGKKPDDKTD